MMCNRSVLRSPIALAVVQVAIGLFIGVANAAPQPALSIPNANVLMDDEAARNLSLRRDTSQDWVYRFHVPESDQKFLTYGAAQGTSPAIGFWPSANAINWRYNDSGRPSGIVASSQDALTLINTAMTRWTSQCGVRFNYLGTSSAAPGLATNSTFDSTNVIGWAPISGNTTGITGVGGSGSVISEADIVLNSSFNPDLLSTIIHEVGHFLGLRHSDVSNVMMSGPPLTSYSGVTNIQTDDINGCRSIFGAPASAPSISGTVQNVPNGTALCANPSAGVSCGTVSGGNYSCTVPSGWTGTLHVQAGNTLRVDAKRFTTGVTSASNGGVFIATTVPSNTCVLDIDNDGLNEVSIDGVMILRKLMGITGTSQAISSSGTCAQRTSASDKVSFLNARNFDVNGDGVALAHREGLIFLRLMLGMTGAQAVNGTGFNWSTLRGQLNTSCGTNFPP
jgi:Matrixin